MDTIEKKISSLIEKQFPAYYRENGPVLVAFIVEYYKWMESTNNTLYHTRRILDYKDIDETVDRFILYFKEKYLKDIQFSTNTDIRKLLKHTLDLYRAKGTERAIDLLFRLVFGVGAEVYYPAFDLFKTSDGTWRKPRYLEVELNENNSRFADKQVRGIESGATAFVEKVIRRTVADRLVDILYISAINGNFITNEVIVVDGDEVLENERIKITGSLTAIDIDINGVGFGYEVGDIVDLTSDKGRQAKGRITSVEDVSGLVNFELINGGYGFNGNAEVIISEKVLTLANVQVNANNQSVDYFYLFETLTQPFANITYSGLTGGTSIPVGTEVFTYHSNNALKGSGVVILSSASSSSAGQVRVVIRSGKIKDQSAYFNANTSVNNAADFITLSTTQPFENNDIVLYTTSAGNTVLSGLTNNTLYFVVGANSTGVKLSTTANGSALDVTASSTSEIGHNLTSVSKLYSTSNTLSADQVTYTNRTATANVIGVSDALTLDFINANGVFVRNEEIYQLNPTNTVEVANGIITTFATSVGANGFVRVANTKGVFRNNLLIRSRVTNTVANVKSSSFNIGVYDISNSFITTDNNFVYGSNSFTNATVTVISQGTGATFNVSNDVLYTETLYDINTDYIRDYANVQLTALTYQFPANTAANLTYGTLTYDPINAVNGALTIQNVNVGKVRAIVSINRGQNYTVAPFVLVYQPEVYNYRIRDDVLTISSPTGNFVIGELVTQSSTNARGIVKQGSNSTTLFVERLRFYEPVYTNSVFNANTGVNNSTDLITTSSAHGLANGDIITYLVSAGNTAISGLSNGASYYVVNSTTSTSLKLSDTAGGSPLNITASLTSETGHKLSKKNFANGVGNSANFVITTESISQIVGEDSGFTANVTSVTIDGNTKFLGLNSIILANTITGNGSVTSMEIVDSGFGYLDDEELFFENENGISSGFAIVRTQGKSLGFYRDRSGFLSDDKKLHDGNYYQEYSYEVRSSVTLNKYSEMLRNVLHVAGTKYFGALVYNSLANAAVTIPSISVTKTTPQLLTLEIGGYLLTETEDVLETES